MSYDIIQMNKTAKLPISAQTFSARPVAAAIWPKRWGNDQAAGRRQTRRRGGVMTRGVPRGCVGGQVGRGGQARACLQLRKKTSRGRGKVGPFLLEYFHI